MFSTNDAHCTLNNPSTDVLSNVNVNEQMRRHTDGNSVIIFRFKYEHWEVVGMIMTAWVGAHMSGMTLLTGLKFWCFCIYVQVHYCTYISFTIVLYPK